VSNQPAVNGDYFDSSVVRCGSTSLRGSINWEAPIPYLRDYLRRRERLSSSVGMYTQERQPGLAGQIQRFSKWIVRAAGARSAGNQSVLVISREGLDSIGRLCRRLQWELNYASNLPAALQELQHRRFDVVIYDQDMPNEDWRLAVTSLAATAPWSSVLLLSPARQPELWNEVIRQGGHDMLNKPISEDVVESAVALAMARTKLRGLKR
jgi:CheY-like chemotaxis protein